MYDDGNFDVITTHYPTKKLSSRPGFFMGYSAMEFFKVVCIIFVCTCIDENEWMSLYFCIYKW